MIFEMFDELAGLQEEADELGFGDAWRQMLRDRTGPAAIAASDAAAKSGEKYAAYSKVANEMGGSMMEALVNAERSFAAAVAATEVAEACARNDLFKSWSPDEE